MHALLVCLLLKQRLEKGADVNYICLLFRQHLKKVLVLPYTSSECAILDPKRASCKFL